MSDVLYPIAAIERQRVTADSRVIIDPFEAGNTTTRRLWADKEFKRKFAVGHAPLHREEFNALRNFFVQRNGRYDTFWFRDNVNREGNAKVRFAGALPHTREKLMNSVGVELDEVAPVRLNPDLYEVTNAAGTAPLIWWDSNRQRYFEHPSAGVQTVYKDADLWDVQEDYPGVFQGGTALKLGGITSAQWNYYSLDAQQWAKTSGNVTQFSGTQPAATVMAFVRNPNTSSAQTILSVGGTGTGSLSIVLNATDYYGWAGSGASDGQQNSPVDTWRSVAISWASASNTHKIYGNAALLSTVTVVRSYVAGPASLGAFFDGTQKMENATDARVAHAMIWNAELTLAQIKAVHNLFAYQVGLPLVA